MMYKTCNNQQHLSITLTIKMINEYVLFYGRPCDYRIRCHVPTSKCGHVSLTVHTVDAPCGLTHDHHDRVDHHTKQNYPCPYYTRQNMKLKTNLCSIRQQGQILFIFITSTLFVDTVGCDTVLSPNLKLSKLDRSSPLSYETVSD